MADSDYVSIELEVAGRTLKISCLKSMQEQVLAAAEKLNLDLHEFIGGKNISSAELFEHLFSLTLEYICGENKTEEMEQDNRLVRLTHRLNQALVDSES